MNALPLAIEVQIARSNALEGLELAKFLKLDPQQVARTYLRRAKDLLELRG